MIQEMVNFGKDSMCIWKESLVFQNFGVKSSAWDNEGKLVNCIAYIFYKYTSWFFVLSVTEGGVYKFPIVIMNLRFLLLVLSA